MDSGCDVVAGAGSGGVLGGDALAHAPAHAHADGHGHGHDGMLNVAPGTEGATGAAAVAAAAAGAVGATAHSLTTAAYAPPDTDQAQFEADKRAVYKHPLFPLLALLFERCELATQSSEAQSSDAFNLDIQAFVQHQERDRKPFLANEPEIDGLMIKAIQVLRIHLLELEKVQELCKDFCNRYITCLKGKMQSENLLRSDYTQGPVMTTLENNNNMLPHGNSESGSDSNSPVQYTISPTQQGGVNPPGAGGGSGDCLEQRGGLLAATDGSGSGSGSGSGAGDTTTTTTNTTQMHAAHSHSHSHSAAVYQQQQQHQQQQQQQQAAAVAVAAAAAAYVQQAQTTSSGDGSGGENNPITFDPHVIHGSTPIGQIGVNICPAPVDPTVMSGQLSPAPTTPGGSADDCDSDFTGRVGSVSSKKQKRGVLPKHATSVMRSWLFQHLVHPYPTEDEKRHIAAQTNLTLLQVNNWFINARRRILQPMLDAGAPAADAANTLAAQKTATQRKKSHNSSNRRFWPQDLAGLQPQINSGVLSSSDDECDSYSSDGEEGGLVIDANADGVGGGGGGGGGSVAVSNVDGNGANGHHVDTPNSYSPESDQP